MEIFPVLTSEAMLTCLLPRYSLGTQTKKVIKEELFAKKCLLGWFSVTAEHSLVSSFSCIWSAISSVGCQAQCCVTVCQVFVFVLSPPHTDCVVTNDTHTDQISSHIHYTMEPRLSY